MNGVAKKREDKSFENKQDIHFYHNGCLKELYGLCNCLRPSLREKKKGEGGSTPRTDMTDMTLENSSIVKLAEA